MGFIVKFFEAIRDFFASIFFPKSPKTIKRKKLKHIYNKLKVLPKPLLTKDLFVLPDFAKIVFSIYAEVLPIKSVFDQTIMNEDLRIANRFKDVLIKEAFSDEQKKEFIFFSYVTRDSELQTEAIESLEILQCLLKDQSKKFHSFIRELRTPELTKAEHTIQDIYSLYDFCCFDFYGLLSPFMNINQDYFDEIVKKGTLPKFNKIVISKVMKELLDFNFVLKNLNIDDNLIMAIELMHKKATNSSDNKFFFVVKQILMIKDIIKKEFAGEIVLGMVQYAKGDPDFDDKTITENPHILDDFIERLEARFSTDTKKLLMIFQEEKIGQLVKDTFGDRKFFGFVGYNDKINTKLQNSTSLGFNWIRPMELLLTFTKQRFEVNMKPLIKTILVEGFFVDNSFQNALGASFYYCENLSDKFEEFERCFTDGEKCSLTEINGYLDEINNGGDFEKPLGKLVDEANTSAKNIVQNAVEQYNALYLNCSQLIADAKRHNSELVSNIKVLFNSIKLRSLVGVFERDTQMLERFLEIMKNYAILVHMDIN